MITLCSNPNIEKKSFYKRFLYLPEDWIQKNPVFGPVNQASFNSAKNIRKMYYVAGLSEFY